MSVVLATYNRAPSLEKTLASFSNLVYPRNLELELLVVDNNSTDSTHQLVQGFCRSAAFCVRYLFEKRQGKSSALNHGISIAQGEIVAFTDDDVLLHPDWLANLIGTFERFDCSAVAGRVVPLWNHDRPEWLEIAGQQAVVNFELGDEIKVIRVPPLGANSAFRRKVFAMHGRYRLDLGVSGTRHTITCEDTEFGLRLLNAGETIIYSPDAIVYHPVDPKRTTKKYFLDWYYYNGVSLTRTAGLPNFGAAYFGVPRWLYRELSADWIRWMLSVDRNRRFNCKLRTYRSAGKILESRRLSRAQTASGNTPVLQQQATSR
ncbi:MAG TPA: glycosyltransferase family 2 protein [Verrucomicrobiae bacterium]|nr:glycosyltransferase family 2 protein [Verrucomicrobiae bacterium]